LFCAIILRNIIDFIENEKYKNDQDEQLIVRMIDKLTFIKELNFFKQYLSTKIGNNLLCNLSELKKLTFSYNNIEIFQDRCFANQNKLIHLNLSSNKIKKISSETFFGLKSLTTLSIGLNRISEIEDDCFKHLNNLESLSLSFNQIVKINKNTFSKLDQLIDLRLNFNKINEIHDDSFNNLTNLKNLYLYKN